jgi:glycosyltransferase involved in cell wall biosynthesis
MALVSVVVPCFRHENFVADCLESVCSQTYPEIELIVIDDQSQDRTFEVAADLCASQKYRERFRKVTCQRNEKNIGAHASLNKGVGLAQGETIALLNSDDQYHPSRIFELRQALRDRRTEFAFSNYVFIDDANREVPFDLLFIELQAWTVTARNSFPALSFAFLQRQIALSTGNFFLTKKLFERVGGFLDLKYCHDLDFVLQAVRLCEPAFVDKPFYRYRVHEGNSFRSLGEAALAETEFALTRYFKACEFSGTINSLAPCAVNWPGFFEVLLKRWNLEAYYTRAISGYYPWHKVVDPSALAGVSERTPRFSGGSK